MGQSSSSRRRRRNNELDHHNPPPPAQLLSPSSSLPSPPPPPPPPPPPLFSHLPPPPPPPPPPPSYVFAANAPYPTASYAQPYPAPSPYHLYSQQAEGGGYGAVLRVFGSLMGRSGYPQPQSPYYGPYRGNEGWPSSSSAAAAAASRTRIAPPPYVEHQKATTVKNDVNLHKDSIRLEPDEHNPDQHLVSFTFDSLVDGSFTISYFAKEGTNCSFSPVYPDMYVPMKIPFQNGLGQKFHQPSGSGIDLGFFELDDLSRPSYGDVFPLVVYAEAFPPTLPTDELADQSTAAAGSAQITLAVIEKQNVGPFQVKVIQQILWLGGKRYELQEIFDLGISAEAQFDDDDDDPEKECVICMSEPRDTAVLPCRHMCMCGDCAKQLRLQSNKCPICRQPVEKLMEIPNQRKKKGTSGDQGGMS